MGIDLIYLFLLIPFFIYWCINEKAGLQICITTILCIWAVLLYRHFKEDISIDVDLSFIIAAVFFGIDLLIGKKINALLSKGGMRAYLITASMVSFFMILYRPTFEYVYPGGILLGICLGYYFNKRYIGFKSADVLERKGIKKALTLIMRFVLGTALLAIILLRVNQLINDIIQRNGNDHYIQIYAFLSYMVMALWVSVAAPWVFTKIKLAGLNAPDSAEKNDN
jgi:hypothetical protein